MATVHKHTLSRLISVDPNLLNEHCGFGVYRCIGCKCTSNLHFYQHTSTPVCDKPECIRHVEQTWQHENLPVQQSH